MIVKKDRSYNLSKINRSLWFDRLMAILAILNLGLVIFDLSYIPWHNSYFKHFPQLTKLYNPFKGIEPHRATQNYLDTVAQLKQQVSATGINSPEANLLLAQLREISATMIDENPFAFVGKTATLEKIKKRIRQHIPNPQNSSKTAFEEFWSQPYLVNNDFVKQIAWFDQEIAPLIASNYYRKTDENGQLEDNFFWLELPFTIIFTLEFLGRTFIIRRRWQSVSWLGAMLWRWYDIFLILPFFRWLRIIPVLIRINDAEIIDLEPYKVQAGRVFVASFGQELTEMVVMQLLSQVQREVKSGDLIKQAFQASNKRYLDINNVNEIETIASRLVQVVICRVLPKMQPDLEALMMRNIENTLKLSPAYQRLQVIPGIGDLPKQIAEKLITELSKVFTEGPKTAYDTITNIPDDAIASELAHKLVQNFGKTLGSELQRDDTLQEIQLLLLDFLEEVKINYIQQLSEEDFDKLAAETSKLLEQNQ